MTDFDTQPLGFGIFHGPHHARNLDPTYAYQRDLLLMENLDRLGFDEAWIGEHHSGGFEIIAAPEVFIAAAAERTRRIRLGTGVKSLPYHHPFIIAETMAQHGHVPDRADWRITMYVHLAETREQARKDCEYGLEAYVGYANDIVPAPNPIPRGLPDPVAYIHEVQRGVVGTPEDAIREISRVYDALGGFGAILLFQHDWADWPATLRSMELIAEEVRPHFSGANGLRVASYERNAPHHEEN